MTCAWQQRQRSPCCCTGSCCSGRTGPWGISSTTPVRASGSARRTWVVKYSTTSTRARRVDFLSLTILLTDFKTVKSKSFVTHSTLWLSCSWRSQSKNYGFGKRFKMLKWLFSPATQLFSNVIKFCPHQPSFQSPSILKSISQIFYHVLHLLPIPSDCFGSGMKMCPFLFYKQMCLSKY